MRYEGRRLLPDVDERCEEVAGAITPRVGGVGPTTIAMLFRNAVEAAERTRRHRPVNAGLQPHDDGSHEPDTARTRAVDVPAVRRRRRAGRRAVPRVQHVARRESVAAPGRSAATVLWLWAAALLAIYLVALAVVALVPLTTAGD